MSLSVVSAIYGGWDTPKPIVEQSGATVDEWIMVTDDPDLDAPGWTVICEPRPHVHPCLAAKVAKFNPELYCRPGAKRSLWIDASATFGPHLARMAEIGLLQSRMSMFPHPHRDRLTTEVEVSRTLPKYDPLPLEAQIAHYLGFGMPDNYALWATGAIARAHSDEMTALGDLWLLENVRWSFQDQLSLPYLLWKYGDFRPSQLGPSLFTSPHIQFGPHTR